MPLTGGLNLNFKPQPM